MWEEACSEREVSTPYPLHPAPYTLQPAPCTLQPAPCTLYLKFCTLQPTPCTSNLQPCRGKCRASQTPNLVARTLPNPKPRSEKCRERCGRRGRCAGRSPTRRGTSRRLSTPSSRDRLSSPNISGSNRIIFAINVTTEKDHASDRNDRLSTPIPEGRCTFWRRWSSRKRFLKKQIFLENSIETD